MSGCVCICGGGERWLKTSVALIGSQTPGPASSRMDQLRRELCFKPRCAGSLVVQSWVSLAVRVSRVSWGEGWGGGRADWRPKQGRPEPHSVPRPWAPLACSTRGDAGFIFLLRRLPLQGFKQLVVLNLLRLRDQS